MAEIKRMNAILTRQNYEHIKISYITAN